MDLHRQMRILAIFITLDLLIRICIILNALPLICSEPAETESHSDNPDRAPNQDASVAAFISILERSRSATALGMVRQSHDMKRRPHTAATVGVSHGAGTLSTIRESAVGCHERGVKYVAVDKRERSAEVPFR